MVSQSKKLNNRQRLIAEFAQCRRQTLALLAKVDEEHFCLQAHPDFSPVGWHFGHIAYTESLWLLKSNGHRESLFPKNTRLYAADGLPKSERVHLPSIEETRNLLAVVRSQVIDYLHQADISKQGRVLQFLLQHESQHGETILLVLKLLNNWQNQLDNNISSASPPSGKHLQQMLEIPAGAFIMGSEDERSLDNEKGKHEVYLDTYYIDSYPVTRGQYRQFMAAGGYHLRELWSDEGWKWLQQESVTQPLYWCENRQYDNHPVCGVSYYEAEAFAKFVGKRLPTEAEWEKAARWNPRTQVSHTYPWGEASPQAKHCNFNLAGLVANPNYIYSTSAVDNYPEGKSSYGMGDALGNVWEWTASWFSPYPGFQPYPYPGYSQVYFDNQHRVLKGGSFACRRWSLRASFRNWYHPSVRQIFAGFRCAVG